MSHALLILCVLFGIAVTGIAVGIRLAKIPEIAHRIVPFSGGVLVGIAIFWVLPEIAERSGVLLAVLGLMAGFGILWLIDRLLKPHELYRRPMRGLALPLLAAASVHSFFDGWSLGVSQQQASAGIKMAFLVGIGVHKLPEGLALGALLLAATGGVWKAALSALAVQSGMFVGAIAAILVASNLAPQAAAELLAVAAGVFVYLGYHAIEDPVRERGWAGAFLPALSGAASAAMLRLVPGI